jgi:protein arginine kinase activator
MLCDVCRERDASVHLTQVVQGEVTQLHLCAKCAAERGIETTVMAPPQKHILGDFLQAVQQQTSSAQTEALQCAFCGMTMRDFRATGRLGCAHCYGTFERSLRELLRRVQGSAKHVGRRYEPPPPSVLEGTASVSELRERLRRAIENEEFELAAVLRDQIKSVE